MKNRSARGDTNTLLGSGMLFPDPDPTWPKGPDPDPQHCLQVGLQRRKSAHS